MNLEKQTKDIILQAQKNEITEHLVYKKLAERIGGASNKRILSKIAEDEESHYYFWKEITGQEVAPDWFKFWKYYFITRFFGLTFGIKLMEKGEEEAQVIYNKIQKVVPEAERIVEEEDIHEEKLLAMIDEERLRYMGSLVLGLNDALVELTGALAGFTLTLQDSKVVAVAGLVTGIAASFSMAASEYLSQKNEKSREDPLRAALYTGLAYLLTVFVLILPFLLLKNTYLSLFFTLLGAVLIILFFNFYISIAQDVSFKERFKEMIGISLGVSFLTFGIGFLIREFLKIDI